jgi:UDP-glucose 4-epimerase
MQKILITGVSGFIGRALAAEGVSKGYSVFGIGGRVDGATGSVGGLTEAVSLRLPSPEVAGLIAEWKPDILFHCAGSAFPARSVTEPSRDFECSVPVLQNLLEAVRTSAPKAHVIFLSSAAIYGQPESLPISEELPPAPLSPYGYHKWLGEILCREYAEIYGLRTSSARIFSAYGPGLERQIIRDSIGKFLGEKEPVFFGTGRETRDFIFINDLVDALYRIGECEGEGHEVINVASGEETLISAAIEMVAEQMNVAGGTWRFSGEEALGIPSTWKADVSKLKGIGFEPEFSFAEGIAKTLSYALRKVEGKRVS